MRTFNCYEDRVDYMFHMDLMIKTLKRLGASVDQINKLVADVEAEKMEVWDMVDEYTGSNKK